MTAAEHGRMKNATENGPARASVWIAGTTYNLPIRKGTLGPDVVDIGSLYRDTGRFTYDPGFTSTASCESKTTFIAFDNRSVFDEFTTVPVQIYNWTIRPQEAFRQNAAAAIIVLMVAVLTLNLIAALIRERFRNTY